jgi:hypothetical protein
MRIHLLLCSLGRHDWRGAGDSLQRERYCSVCRLVEHQIDVPGMPWVSGPAFKSSLSVTDGAGRDPQQTSATSTNA